jgi:hypothetical protein
MALLEQRSGSPINRTPEDYLGESPRRIFRFQPKEGWLTGERLAIGNQLVDTKITFDLLALQELYQSLQ